MITWAEIQAARPNFAKRMTAKRMRAERAERAAEIAARHQQKRGTVRNKMIKLNKKHLRNMVTFMRSFVPEYFKNGWFVFCVTYGRNGFYSYTLYTKEQGNNILAFPGRSLYCPDVEPYTIYRVGVATKRLQVYTDGEWIDTKVQYTRYFKKHIEAENEQTS